MQHKNKATQCHGSAIPRARWARTRALNRATQSETMQSLHRGPERARERPRVPVQRTQRSRIQRAHPTIPAAQKKWKPHRTKPNWELNRIMVAQSSPYCHTRSPMDRRLGNASAYGRQRPIMQSGLSVRAAAHSMPRQKRSELTD